MHQLALFGQGERLFARDGAAEISYFPGLFSPEESQSYFARLRQGIAWRESRTWMYDRAVDVPRLTAYFRTADDWPAPLREMLAPVCERLRAHFTSVGLNFYRDGRDSVAWHSDKNEHLTSDPTVAVVSFGGVREMRIRPVAPPRRSLALALEPGSALVMRGDAQERFEHAILKTRFAEPRISVVFRTTCRSL